jgi:hypothetical protein
MSQNRPRESQQEQQWRRWLAQWQQSGLSVRAFCAAHRLPEQTFLAWRRLIAQRQAAACSFVSVQVVPDEQPAAVSCFEILMPGGLTLRVPPGFDRAALRQLLAILREGPPC